MPTETGIWNINEALQYHDFSYRLAKFIGGYLPKDKPLIDWGCGRGTYLRYFHDIGFELLHGVEGENLPFFEYSNIAIQDLTKPILKSPQWNSMCIEVGEHIPHEYSEIFIRNIVENTSNTLILSWAIPGQDGIGHVNCRHNVEVIQWLKEQGMYLNVKDTLEIRQHVDNNMAYLRNTLMVFNK